MYYLTNEISTVLGLAHKIAAVENECTNGVELRLMVGPVYAENNRQGEFGTWVSTNGNPIYIASYQSDGAVLWDAADDDENQWLAETLAIFGFENIDALHAAVRLKVLG